MLKAFRRAIWHHLHQVWNHLSRVPKFFKVDFSKRAGMAALTGILNPITQPCVLWLWAAGDHLSLLMLVGLAGRRSLARFEEWHCVQTLFYRTEI